MMPAGNAFQDKIHSQKAVVTRITPAPRQISRSVTHTNKKPRDIQSFDVLDRVGAKGRKSPSELNKGYNYVSRNSTENEVAWDLSEHVAYGPN